VSIILSSNLNIRDLGAVPDGITDNAAIIQSILDLESISTANGNHIVIPKAPNGYFCSVPLYVRRHSTILTGSSGYRNSNLIFPISVLRNNCRSSL